MKRTTPHVACSQFQIILLLREVAETIPNIDVIWSERAGLFQQL